MFKFNFTNENHKDQSENTPSNPSDPNPTWLKSEEIRPLNDNIIIKDIFTNCEENAVDCKGIKVKYFSTVDILNVLRTIDDCESTKTLSVLNADRSHSDLETAVYEGGLKIWECTFDLINYISESDLNLENTQILDLGCGTGIIGLLCLAKGASCTFQDYNAEILQYITIPNVKLNDEAHLNKSRFYSGDWDSFVDVVNIDKFDYIFTSETIYNAENYSKLHNVFERLLKKDGKIYLAAKSYYFGVGGGISLFETFLKNQNVFESQLCWKCCEGLKREILKITFK